jgi:hypothetical protein
MIKGFFPMKPNMHSMCQRWIVLLGLILIGCSGCSSSSSAPAKQDVAWLRDGMIAISRPLPGASSIADTRALAFMPVIQATHSGTWLSISSAEKSVKLMSGDSVITSASGDGLEKVTPGTYQLLHKQRNALWYAPDSYFSSRNLTVPPQGDKSRFRRGALGDFVLYINKDTPIHSGPFWSSDIGGIRLDDSELSRIYYQLPVGAEIEIQ